MTDQFDWNVDPRALPKCSGIYAIFCISTQQVYVGSSINLRTRVCDHRSRLVKGTHRNVHLQSAWDEYGEADFLWAALDVSDDCDQITSLETLYINLFNSSYSNGGGFNLVTDPKNGTRDPDTRARLSAAMLGPSHPHRGKKFSQEYCERAKTRIRSNGPQYGVGYKGVNLDARTETYMARIYCDEKQMFLGRYDTETEAAQAYNNAALVHYGGDCYLNNVPDGVPVRRTTRGRPTAGGRNVG